MQKLPALAAALLTLAATTTGCVVDVAAMADLPSATVISSGRGSTTIRTGAVLIEDRDDDVYVAPARRAPAMPAPRGGASVATNPVIHAFTANPSNFVPAGQPITFQIVAHDPGDAPLQYNWSATGGTLSATSGQLIVWNPPEKPGTYTVSAMISNARGGATSGHQNLIVQADGSAKLTTTEAPKEEPAPAPAKPAPAPVAATPCGCDDDAQDGMGAPAGEIDADEGFAMETFTRYGRR